MGYIYSWTILYEPCLGGKQLSPGSSLGWSLTKGNNMTTDNRDYNTVVSNHDYTRRNRFNGESFELTPEEAKRHDEIFYYEALATVEDEKAGIDGTSKLWDKVRSNLDWFRKHNAKAYMVLLD